MVARGPLCCPQVRKGLFHTSETPHIQHIQHGTEMAKEQKYSEIIYRVEYVRSRLSMNKSKFCTAFGMKAQTYQNFLSKQGSKPSIELLLGMLNVYHVNPYWLLDGIGEVFLESSPDKEKPKSQPARDSDSKSSGKKSPRLRKKNPKAE